MFSLNMLFKRYYIIGLLNLTHLIISLLIEVLNILFKIWLIFALFNVNHSPRTPCSPWTNGLVEVENRNRGTQMYAYAHNTTPLSQFELSPHQIVFHTHPRIPLTFFLNLTRDSSKTCIASYCNSLPPHTHYSDQDLNPLFHSLPNKPISLWLLFAEHSMLEIFSTLQSSYI